MISPFNAWLISRGAITLPLRLTRHLDSAQQVAEFLEADDRVAYVAYPGLPSHPNTRSQSGSSAVAGSAP